MKFLVSSEDCELLMALLHSETLMDLSVHMKRDVSVLSRRLNKLNQITGFLEKKNGRWLLTKEGRLLCDWAIKASNEQSLILNRKNKISLATTREFASRMLIPNWNKVNYDFDQIELITSDGNSENLLLENLADIAIDCGTPYHPDVRFKKIAKEKMIIAASSEFIKRNKGKELNGEDYIHFHRTDINALQEDMNLKLNPKFIFSDLSTLRSALIHNHGWGLIPQYVVKEDLQKKTLIDLNIKLNSPMSFGVWWKKDLEEKELILALVQFLKEIEL
ncbi:MAG: substrate-binding domain-containing protein [Bacteriovorax sp.]